MGNDGTINLQLNKELQTKFRVWCQKEGITMAQMLRNVIKQLVDEPKVKLEV